MSRITIFLLFIFILNVSCRREEPMPSGSQVERFVFGIDFAECTTDCARLYKLEGNQLLADEVNHFSIHYPAIQFSTTPLSEDKYAAAKQLLDAMPGELLAATEKRFGEPNAHDQGGIIIGLQTTGQPMKYWYLDPIEDRLPAYLQPYTREVQAVLGELR
ncbi:MAG: hypothetical protein ICV83_16785 [Cytophagales bacterium]|nr:hypothetical protein [Cytophagales bacterium]